MKPKFIANEIRYEHKKDEINRLYKKFLTEAPDQSETYKCPNCGKHGEIEDVIFMTESVFNHEPDPHYTWTEIHKCPECSVIYKYTNGT